VAFVHRPEMYTDPKSEKMEEVQGKAEIIVGKQRNGPIDDVTLAFVSRYARFENLALPSFEALPPGPEETPF
jgi:replicative DNA helicase